MYKKLGMETARRAGGARALRMARAGGRDSACDLVIALVAKHKRVPVRLLVHRSRCRMRTARARQLAMYLCHVALGRSLYAVGTVFGRDRTTVSHACGLIEDMRDDPAFEDEVAALELQIETAVAVAAESHDGTP